MDTISVKKFDRAGNAVGEQLFVGLLTPALQPEFARDSAAPPESRQLPGARRLRARQP